jgi:glucokinase
MTDSLAVGVDLGGTKIAFALVDRQGAVLKMRRTPTLPGEGPAAVLERIAAGIRGLLDEAGRPVDGVGIGSPGHLDPVEGVVHNAVNLGWHGVRVTDELRQRLPPGLPLFLQRDTNAAAVGEMLFGATRGARDFVYLAAGTGLGGAAVVGGRLITGAWNNAMEVGHLSLDPDGRLCGCGTRGCAETVVSGLGLLAGVRERGAEFPASPLVTTPGPTTQAILAAAERDDPLALAVLDDAGRALGTVMAACVCLFNPALIVIGGGLGRAAARWLLPVADREMRRRVYPPAVEGLRVTESRITISAIGAACLVWYDP